MAENAKITGLPNATLPLAGTEKAEIVQGGVNKQVDVSEFAGAAGTGIVETIVAGTNVTVDSTDPANPIVSASGGGGGTWGSITGTLSSQTDLQTALDLKAPLASPTFTGTPAAPTAAPGTNTTQVATTAFVQAANGGKADQFITLRTEVASHTLDATDLASVNAGDQLVVMMNVAGANNLTIPLNATQAFPVGSVIGIRQIGAGQTTIVATGGVTLNAPLNALKLAAQNGLAFIEKTATDTWYANGELSL